MADLGTIGVSARAGVSASGGASVRPAVLSNGMLGPVSRGIIGRSIGDGFPQSVNPIVQRRAQMFTADSLLSSD
jgi:hypothetical protein